MCVSLCVCARACVCACVRVYEGNFACMREYTILGRCSLLLFTANFYYCKMPLYYCYGTSLSTPRAPAKKQARDRGQVHLDTHARTHAQPHTHTRPASAVSKRETRGILKRQLSMSLFLSFSLSHLAHKRGQQVKDSRRPQAPAHPLSLAPARSTLSGMCVYVCMCVCVCVCACVRARQCPHSLLLPPRVRASAHECKRLSVRVAAFLCCL